MKGFILSSVVFLFYVIGSALLSHFLKPKRHSKLFIPLLGMSVIFFLLAYQLTPASLGFLSVGWQATHAWLDQTLGIVILVLNIHSYIDWFFGFNGGFSTSLMLILIGKSSHGATTQELIDHYHSATGDKIHGWRLPRLEETGYLEINQQSHYCSLTKKGRLIAMLAKVIKKILNLGLGG